ncbi:MAG: hypothetical protein Q8L48_07750 [Archangium sp.]|nr:hypothetical protein [Archangium sp.]
MPNDGHFGAAFALPTVDAAQNKAIDATPSGLVLTIPVVLHLQAQPVATLVEALGRAGGLGVRIEQSKLGYPLPRWVELVKSADPLDLYRAAVLVLTDREAGTLKSCGMHVFSLPDAEIEAGWQGILDVFNVFQLAEDPVLRSGETFAPDARTPRRRIERWPDGGYPDDHPCHNPFGVWRFGPEGGKASKQRELELVFMPALVTVLLASEETAGRALTRAEVEEVVEKGVCMAMKPRDAQKLERSRGYSDIDPERGWDQWRVVREGLRDRDTRTKRTRR